MRGDVKNNSRNTLKFQNYIEKILLTTPKNHDRPIKTKCMRFGIIN